MLLDQLGVVGLKSVLASPAPHDEPHLCGSRLAEGQQGHEPLSPAQEPFSTASAMSSHRVRYSATAALIGSGSRISGLERQFPREATGLVPAMRLTLLMAALFRNQT